MATGNKYSAIKRKPRLSTIIIIVLAHVLAIYGLARAFAPGAVETVEQSVVSAFTVTVTTPDEEIPPENEQVPDEGAAGEAGKKAVAKPDSQPETPLKRDKPKPRASSTGTADTSGAKENGVGTGAAGQGNGTGSGRGGSGQGGAVVQKPSVKSGSLNTATDFPIPDGGRQTRFGKSVLVHFTVTTNGKAKNCSVRQSNVDSQSAAMVCPLVIQKIRFNPAKDANGNAVEDRYGYRVKFDPVG